jgi:hypothetical protein
MGKGHGNHERWLITLSCIAAVGAAMPLTAHVSAARQAEVWINYDPRAGSTTGQVRSCLPHAVRKGQSREGAIG